MHEEHHVERGPVDREAQESFWKEEFAALTERNRGLAAERAKNSREIEQRREVRESVVVDCMDERDTATEESLGLLPGEAEVYGSAGGKVDPEQFEKLYGAKLAAAERSGKESVVYLTTHESSDGHDLGCAAFKNDMPAQIRYFKALKEQIADKHPKTKVHVLSFDTSTGALAPISPDDRDQVIGRILSKPHPDRVKDAAHAGYGIYVGGAHRAWAPARNAYFNISAENPDIVGNAGIALAVMEHHSEVDLSKKPVVLHVDYPKFPDAARTESARENLNKQVDALLAGPEFKALADSGALKVVKTETDTETWQGRML